MKGNKQVAKGSTTTKPDSKKATTWWQWLLIYPTLLIAIVSAMPTYIELFKSHKFDVPFGESAFAEQQDDLWKKNIECLKAPLDWYENEYNIRVDATICKSGDILIWAEDPKGNRAYRWVSPNRMFLRRAAVSLPSEAYAADQDLSPQIAQTNMKIICQKIIAAGRILRRVQTPNGCYDEIINSYNGQVLQRKPAPCDPNC